MTEVVEEAPFRELSLSDRPPVNVPADFRLADGKVVVGWRVYDSILGKSFYWAWTKDAPLPTKYESRFQRDGMTPIKPVAWRARPKVVIRPPDEVMSRREAEVLVHRAILTDGTMRSGFVKGVKSTWDDSWHNDPDWERNVGDLIGVDLSSSVQFRPTPLDQQNYDDGTVLRWFASLRPANLKRPGFSEEQLIVVLYAYGRSFDWIGGKLGRSEDFIKEHYLWALDRVWGEALKNCAGVRRLPRELWADQQDRPRQD